MASANIVMLTEDNFRAEVLQSDKPVLVVSGQHGAVHAK